jgi:hypothetical protein
MAGRGGIQQVGWWEQLEIGRILHLKSESRDLKLDFATSARLSQSDLIFRISDLRCRNRPISKFV